MVAASIDGSPFGGGLRISPIELSSIGPAVSVRTATTAGHRSDPLFAVTCPPNSSIHSESAGPVRSAVGVVTTARDSSGVWLASELCGRTAL